MISDERLTKALTFLAETDEEVAELKGVVAALEYRAKMARAAAFTAADGSVEQRKQTAELDPNVQIVEGNLNAAIIKYEAKRAKRATEALIVDVWRSLSANRRQGVVT